MAQRKEGIHLKIDLSDLKPAQARLINKLCHNLRHILTVQDEAEYFDGCAEVLRHCAALIKQADFGPGETPYSDQALEYSIDTLQEYMANSKLIVYDN